MVECLNLEKVFVHAEVAKVVTAGV